MRFLKFLLLILVTISFAALSFGAEDEDLREIDSSLVCNLLYRGVSLVTPEGDRTLFVARAFPKLQEFASQFEDPDSILGALVPHYDAIEYRSANSAAFIVGIRTYYNAFVPLAKLREVYAHQSNDFTLKGLMRFLLENPQERDRQTMTVREGRRSRTTLDDYDYSMVGPGFSADRSPGFGVGYRPEFGQWNQDDRTFGGRIGRVDRDLRDPNQIENSLRSMTSQWIQANLVRVSSGQEPLTFKAWAATSVNRPF